MPEAEDVLLEVAHRATAVARDLWSRPADAMDARAAREAEAQRRLGVWLEACFGRSWPIVWTDPPRPPGWLARRLGDPPPWPAGPAPFTDGRRLFLPRDCAAREARELALLTALGLGWRLARGRPAPAAGDAMRRDLTWLAEAARADAALVRSLPGLAPALVAQRRRTLETRPAGARLRPAERSVEDLLRRLLRAPLADRPSAPEWEAAEALADRLARRVSPVELARYRGFAPVPHWGAPRPDLVGRTAPGGLRPASPPSRTGRPVRRLPRHVERREPEAGEADPRPGPFVLPYADPHLSVQDAAGLARPPDSGEEDLDALADALAHEGRMAVVRDDRPVRDVLEAGDGGARGVAASRVGEVDGGVLVYPEWDLARGGYRHAGCHLRERLVTGGETSWVARVRQRRAVQLARLRRSFEALRPRRTRLSRQLDGDDLDVDGWVEEWAEKRGGGTPPGRLYTLDRPRRRDVAVALLLDASASTDAWVSGGQRVIDVAREAALCFCEALSALGDAHAVYAFSGRGPGDVRVGLVKRFEETLDDTVCARIGGLAPDAFTRLGAPLRHVTARLAREPARIRLLLLLSDGKPDDEDRYEGEYGIQDVRRAVGEAERQGVRVFCVTIDREGPTYLPRLFGPGGFTVLWEVAQIPQCLPEVVRRLT